MMCLAILFETNIMKIPTAKGSVVVLTGLNRPEDVFVAGDGNIYVVDTLNSRISSFDSDGGLLDSQWNVQNLYMPMGICGFGGFIYVADSGNDRVLKLNMDGTTAHQWSGGLSNPIDVATDFSNYLFVTDNGNQRIAVFDVNGGGGGPINLWTGFSDPRGITCDGLGNVYVVDRGVANSVQEYDHQGGLISSWGSGGVGDGNFNAPWGIAADGLSVYVADSFNHRIQKFYNYPQDYIGIFNWAFNFQSQLGISNGVAIDNDKNLYIADTFNDRVLKISQYGLNINKVDPSGLLSYNYVNPFEGGPALYPEGSTVALTAIATQGYIFSCWSGDVTGIDNPKTVTMTSTKSVTANFLLPSASVSVAGNPASYGEPVVFHGDHFPSSTQLVARVTNPDGSWLITSAFYSSLLGTFNFEFSPSSDGLYSVSIVDYTGGVLNSILATTTFRVVVSTLTAASNPAYADYPVTFSGNIKPDSPGLNINLKFDVTYPDGHVATAGTVAVTTGAPFTNTPTTFTSQVGTYLISAVDSSTSEVYVQTVLTVMQRAPSIVLDPSSGNVGDMVTVAGSGFKPGSTTIQIYYDTTLEADSIVAPNGAFSMQFPIPVSADGPYTIMATDPLGGGDTATATFTVTSFVPPSISLSQSSGKINDPVTVTGLGFAPSTRVYILYDTSGTGVNILSDIYGGFSVILHIPYSVAGSHTIRASDTTNSATQQFTVLGLTVKLNCIGTWPGDWSAKVTRPDGSTYYHTFVGSGGYGTDSTSAVLSGGDNHIVLTPKYGYGNDVSVQTDPTSTSSISDDSLDVTVHMDANGFAAVTFTTAKEADTTVPMNSPPPVEMASILQFKVMPIQAAWNPNKNGLTGEVDVVAGKPLVVVVDVPGVTSGTKLKLQFTDAGTPPAGSPTLPSPIEVTVGDTSVSSKVTFPSSASTTQLMLDTAGAPRNVILSVIYSSGTGPTIDPTTVTVRKTNDLSLYYCYLEKSGGQGYPAPSTQGYTDTVEKSKTFMSDTYPVKNVAYTKGASVSGTGTMLKDCMAVADAALKAGREIGVAIVSGQRATTNDPKGYFEARGAPAGAVGVSYGPNFKGVVVAEGYWTAPAHEVGHTYNLYWETPEEYLQKPDYGLGTSGLSAATGNWRTGQDFMGVAPYQTLDKTWVTNEGTSTDRGTYNALFTKFTQTLNDPEMVIVSGIFHKDGTIEMPLAWSRVEQGTASQIESGVYSLRFVGAPAGTTDVPFDAQYYASYSMGVAVGADAPSASVRIGLGHVATDEAGFIFATELPSGTTAIQVLDPVAKTPTNPDGVVATVPRSQIVDVTKAYFTDSSYSPIDTFDCVFTPGTGQYYKMSATNPGTFCYNLKIGNSNPTSVFTVSVDIPKDFLLRQIIPGVSPITINGQPIPASTDSQTLGYSFTPASGTNPGKLSITNLVLNKGQEVTLTVNLDYALKFQNGGPLNKFTAASQTTYAAGYAFRATVTYYLQDDTGKTVNNILADTGTIAAVGKKVTAVGGFLTDVNGVPKGGLTVVANNNPSLTATSTSDGFYFLPPQTQTMAPGTYSIKVYNSLNIQVATANNIKLSKDQFVQKDIDNLNPADPAISGFVKDDSGNGVSGITVQLLNKQGSVFAKTTTNNGGYYVLRFSMPGEYTVKISVPSGYSASVTSMTLNVKQFETAKVNFNVIIKS
jgi:hypothetical protein